MMLTRKFLKSRFVIILRNWEHWPFNLIQFPVYPYYLWLSLKARSFSFFTSCNPGITMGGLLGESKHEILQKIPPHLIPKSVFVSTPTSAANILEIMKHHRLTFPVVFKPDLGEGGWMVEKIHSVSDIENYVNRIKLPFIIQEYVNDLSEFGVFYRRYPSERHGRVISLTRKKFLSVTGDGYHSLKELILRNERTRLHAKKLLQLYADQLSYVLPKDEEMVLIAMGNHVQGATFYDSKSLINDQLHHVFDSISKSIDGFYYGKFDIRCQSEEDLYTGNIKILELNGCGATPSHIFEPGKSYVDCIKRLWQHWNDIYIISQMNQSKGYEPLPDKEAWKYFMRFMRMVGR